MIGPALGILAFALLFGLFGLLRLRSSCSGGCSGCDHACERWQPAAADDDAERKR